MIQKKKKKQKDLEFRKVLHDKYSFSLKHVDECLKNKTDVIEKPQIKNSHQNLVIDLKKINIDSEIKIKISKEMESKVKTQEKLNDTKKSLKKKSEILDNKLGFIGTIEKGNQKTTRKIVSRDKTMTFNHFEKLKTEA